MQNGFPLPGRLQRMGLLDVPSIQRSPWGIVCLVLNILISGVGSIIAGVMGKHSQTLVIGIIQLMLGAGALYLFKGLGLLVWVWSIVWGILIFQKSR